MTIVPTVDAPPSTVPNRSMTADTFVAAMNAWLAWQKASGDQLVLSIPAMNALAAEVNGAAATAQAAGSAAAAAAGYVAESATSFTLATGSGKVFTIPSGKAFTAGDAVVLIRQSDVSARGYGTVTTYTGTTLTLNLTSIAGSATSATDWIVIAQPFEAVPAASAAEVRAGATSLKAVTPAALAASAAFITLTDAATIAWDAATGYNARVTLTASGHTMGAPTNLVDGLSYSLEIVQDATGSRTMSWNAIWDFGASGLPVLQTTAAKADRVFAQYNGRTGKLEASFRRGA